METKRKLDVPKLKSYLSSFPASPLGELAICVAIFIFALLVRLPYLQEVPAFKDESFNWSTASLPVYRGEWPQLVSPYDIYKGPLYDGLIGLAFRIFGLSTELPRTFQAVLGSLTIAFVYVMARMMVSRFAGLVAATLLASSSHHIVFSSHRASSPYAMPFFVLLFLIPFWWSLKRNNGLVLALSGLAAGLSLQAHPLLATVFPGMALYFLFQCREKNWLKTIWPYLGIVLFVIGYAPVVLGVAENASKFSDILTGEHRYHYAFGFVTSIDQYLDRLVGLVWSVALTFSNVLNVASFSSDAIPAQIARGAAYVPMTWLYTSVLLASLFHTVRKREGLLPLVLASALLSISLFMKLPLARYHAFLLPIGHIAIGMSLSWAFSSLAASEKLPSVLKRFVLPLTVVAILVASSAYSVGSAFSFSSGAQATRWNNTKVLQEVAFLKGMELPIIIIGQPGGSAGCHAWARGFSATQVLFSLLSVSGATVKRAAPNYKAIMSIVNELDDVEGGSVWVVPDDALTELKNLPITFLARGSISTKDCYGIYTYH